MCRHQGKFCNRTFDDYACWPDGLPGTYVNVSCPWYLPWANTDLDDGTECTSSKFADHTKLGGVADIPCDCAAIQKDLERLKKWVDRNPVNFCRRKCKVLPLGGIAACTSTDWLEGNFAKKALEVLVDTKLSRSSNVPLRQRTGTASWAVLGRASLAA
ncbi:hypothetical protein QYF61_003769 [Mycteria americana]|uniref:G-protein coupled receptors family 2 profile 1 domain-containing protein n=1 Tax=Mycteria americana TaxID=33587 RepID=A0AAN7PBC9_MYCAM|nr:hypothetical protein QYF61_003769 [Mycteria americana]